jgi:uncharacterized protein (TIGR02246 family)
MRDRPGDRLELQELNSRYAQALDHNDLDAFLAVFAPDALYRFEQRRSQGHAQLADFFTGRQARGPRTTRHLFSGLQLRFTADDEATGNSVWMSFAAQGLPPFSQAEPFLVADMADRYVLQGGRWLFAERRITPVFRQAERS